MTNERPLTPDAGGPDDDDASDTIDLPEPPKDDDPSIYEPEDDAEGSESITATVSDVTNDAVIDTTAEQPA